jgi:hypothetical protein
VLGAAAEPGVGSDPARAHAQTAAADSESSRMRSNLVSGSRRAVTVLSESLGRARAGPDR